MGLLGTLGNIAKAPGSLLWEGLKGAGRNFNRNAMGGLDEIMGSDLTPGMRSVLRAGAMGALGNAIAGKESFGEGVAGNQNRVLGLWQMARQLKEQQAEKEMLRRAYDPQGGPQATTAAPQEAAPVSAPGDPGDPGMSAQAAPRPAAPVIQPGSREDLLQQASIEWARSKYFQRFSGKTAAARAELHAKNASQLRDDAEKLRPEYGEVLTLKGPDGKPIMGRMAKNSNEFFPLGKGLSPLEKWAIHDDGANMFVVNMNDPTQRLQVAPMKLTPGQVAEGERFDKTDDRAERALQEQIRGNVVSEGQRNRQLALGGESNSIGWGRLANEQSKTLNESIYGKPMSGNDAGEAASLSSMIGHIDTLTNALKKDGQAALKRMVTGDAAFAEVIRNVADQLGHHRSQGQVSGREMADYKDLIANPYNLLKGKGIDAAVRSLQSLRNESELALVLMDPSGRTGREQRRIVEGRPPEPPPSVPVDPRVQAYIKNRFGKNATVRPK